MPCYDQGLILDLLLNTTLNLDLNLIRNQHMKLHSMCVCIGLRNLNLGMSGTHQLIQNENWELDPRSQHHARHNCMPNVCFLHSWTQCRNTMPITTDVQTTCAPARLDPRSQHRARHTWSNHGVYNLEATSILRIRSIISRKTFFPVPSQPQVRHVI